MPNIITQLSDESFEAFLAHANASDVIDLRQVAFIDPYGMVGILEAGRMFSQKDTMKTLKLPVSDNVLKYLERMDFFKYAARFFQIDAGDDLLDRYSKSSYSDVLLEITPIEKSDDIHFIVGKVKERAHMILAKHLNYDEGAINGFIVALSEVCQNIIEHSGNTGFVGIQKYRFQKLEKNVVKIAVMDLGIGFRKSLGERFDIKDDIEAVDKALFHAVSRHEDEGRGHGLASVRRFVNKWNGKISIRSGSAKLAVVPEWSWGKKRETNLTYFPGAQINIMLPEI
ncbi:MAG TPA: ATP-binding protein [Nitrospirae bacterium]|nr:histidine kinase-, DNA gyrase B-, and HSP90-like ATPase [bacterium BMS3Bbin09]HDH34154.1 ATP-binding protein [Nitrospirota bacterium]HDO67168.1 ATP-binding protein [Nitrospirota bacterium]HDZ84263.1 ATP-binding protein [Nitrospirota bacterium]HEW81342.1 ATP-binding protein [Nitrospirota bacterium]